MSAIKKRLVSRQGFTLLELIIVIVIIGVITTAIMALLNPAQQFALTRNNQRKIHLASILNYIEQNKSDNDGVFTCASGDLPTSTKILADVSASGSYNIAPCLVPNYAASMPFDPNASGTKWASTSSYNTGYNIYRDATTSWVTLSAPYAELGQIISVTR